MCFCKIIALFIFQILLGLSIHAQDSSFSRPRNIVYLEHGGNAVEGTGWCFNDSRCHPWKNISINYERLIYEGPKVKSTVRIGSGLPFKREIHIIPLMVNLLVGRKSSHFEVGFGYEFIFLNNNYSKAFGAVTGVIGYRYQPRLTGFVFRAGLTPSIGIVGSLWGGSIIGVSAGYKF
jgi:hypothetical protein